MNWQTVSEIATASGVLLAYWQLRRSVRQAQIDFEDDLNREYRELIRGIPPEAQFGLETSESEFAEAFPRFYQYFDLTNEQIFLRTHGRVGKITWSNWSTGIKSTMSKPAFRRAWERIRESSDNFSELRQLESSNFTEDPYGWPPLAERVKRWVRQ